MVESGAGFCPQIPRKWSFHRFGLNEVLLVGCEIVFDLWISSGANKIIELVGFGFGDQGRSGSVEFLLFDFVDDGEMTPINSHY